MFGRLVRPNVAQGTISHFTKLNLGTKQEVVKGRGTVSLRISDIFNTLQFKIDSYNSSFQANQLCRCESRIGVIGFSYRLSRQKINDKDNDERSELLDRERDLDN